jgi:Flp pilus assembly pilin Flp
MKEFFEFLNNDNGAELAEYAVTIALLVAIGVIVYNLLGQAIADQNSGNGADIKNVPRSFPF